MRSRAITAIIVVISLMTVSLLAGCTTSNTTPSPSPSAATHDAFLEKYLTALENDCKSNTSRNVTAWELEWLNGTSARVQSAAFVKSTNRTWAYDRTFIVFPSTQDASNYVNATNKTAYSLYSTQYESGAYLDVTGHAPQVYKDYWWNEGNPHNISAYMYHGITQLDNIVVISTAKILWES